MTQVARVLFPAVALIGLSFAATTANAGAWQKEWDPAVGEVYRDLSTGLVWSKTLGKVPSNQNGAGARAHVESLGFRLPTFQELQWMYNHAGGGPLLNIRNGLMDYYETLDPAILGNAYGNGFQTYQYRRGIGYNWYLGVR